MSGKWHGPLFLVVTFLFYLAQYMYAPFLTPYVGVLGGSLAMTGLVAGSYGALQFILRVPFGLWSDHRKQRKPFIVFGSLLAGLSALGMASAGTAEHLLVFRATSGVAAATWVAFTVFYASLYPPAETGKRIALLTCAGSSGQLAGNLIGGLLAEHGGWRAPFWGAALPGLLGAVAAVVLTETRPVPVKADDERGQQRPRLTQVATWSIIEPSLLTLLTHFIFYATILGFTPVYANKLGLSRLMLGLLGTAGGAAYVLGTLVATRMEAARLPWRGILGGSLAAMAGANWLTTSSHTFPQLAAIFAVLGLCRGTTYPVAMAAVLRSAPAGHSATGMGLFQAIYAIGMFAGPALAGLLAEHAGLGAVFPFTGALALGGALWCLLVRAPRASKLDSPCATS